MYSIRSLLVFGTLVIACALGQSDNNLDLDLEAVRKSVPGLPDFDESAIPQKEEIEKALREKCEKNGGSLDDIIKQQFKVQECLSQYINQSTVMEELEEAKKDGSMDDVFGKYCRRRTQIMGCITDVTKKIEKCLEPSEQDNLKMFFNITDSLIDFVCYKDGDRLAMFVAEGGFECLQDHKDALQQCVNKTVHEKMPKDFSLTNLPLFNMGDEQCDDMIKIQKCAVEELEKCKNNTPANIVEALFKFIKKVSPCKDYRPGGTPAAQRKQRRSDDDFNEDEHQHRQTSKNSNKVKRASSVDFTTFENFSGKCQKYGGPNAFRDLSASVDHLKECVHNQLRTSDACVRMPGEVRNCVNHVINKLRVCLPPQESYLPGFAHSSTDSLLKYVCDDNGYNYNRFIQSTGLTCFIHGNVQSLNDCLSGTQTRRTKDNDIVTKNELCDDLDKVKLCFTTFVNNHCSEDRDFKEVVLGMVDAFKSPCTGCSIYSSSALLLSSIIFVISKYFN